MICVVWYSINYLLELLPFSPSHLGICYLRIVPCADFGIFWLTVWLFDASFATVGPNFLRNSWALWFQSDNQDRVIDEKAEPLLVDRTLYKQPELNSRPYLQFMSPILMINTVKATLSYNTIACLQVISKKDTFFFLWMHRRNYLQSAWVVHICFAR